MEKLLNKLNKESYYLRFNPGENVKTVPDLPLFIVVCSIQAKPSLGYPTLLFLTVPYQTVPKQNTDYSFWAQIMCFFLEQMLILIFRKFRHINNSWIPDIIVSYFNVYLK
jgi:hypothetical protein